MLIKKICIQLIIFHIGSGFIYYMNRNFKLSEFELSK